MRDDGRPIEVRASSDQGALSSGSCTSTMSPTQSDTSRGPPAVVTFGSNYFYSLSNDVHGEESDGGLPPWDSDTLPLSVACSAQSTLVLTEPGAVYQIGTLHGMVRSRWTRVEIPFPLPCVQVAAGRHFCLARLQGGHAVVAWGAGHFGQLGVPLQQNTHSDTGTTPIAVSARPILIDRLLPSCTGSPIASIAAGDWHGMALTQSGQVWAWGLNRSLQCGLPHPHQGSASRNTSSSSSTSTAPGMLSVPLPIAGVPPMKCIAAGKTHSCALTVDGGRPFCWGSSHFGQCGTGVACKRSVAGLLPGPVTGLPASLEMVDLAAAGNHCLCVSKAGRVFGWGDGQEGQLGVWSTGTTSHDDPVSALQDFQCHKPRLVVDLDFVAVEANQLQQQYKLSHQTGTTSLASSTTSMAETLASVPKITRVYAAPTYSAALSSSGHVYCWGNNDVGQLGLTRPDQWQRRPHIASPHRPDEIYSDDDDSYSDDDSTQDSHRAVRPMHVRTFDSNHNVVLPMRVAAVDHVRVTDIAAGPNHMLCFGTRRSKHETTVVGRTLYEVLDDPPIQRVLLPRLIEHTASGTPSMGSETKNPDEDTENLTEDVSGHQQLDTSAALEANGLGGVPDSRHEPEGRVQPESIVRPVDSRLANDSVATPEKGLQLADTQSAGKTITADVVTEDVADDKSATTESKSGSNMIPAVDRGNDGETAKQRGILKCFSDAFFPRQWSWKSNRNSSAMPQVPVLSQSSGSTRR